MELREEIEKVAYEIYLNGGRVDGRDVDNWIEAERIVKARRAAAAPSAKKAVTKTAKSAGAAPKAAAKKAASKARP